MRRYLSNQFTWNDDWIRPFESCYSVLRNIAKINGFRVSANILCEITKEHAINYNDFFNAVPCKGYGQRKALLKFNELIGMDSISYIPPKVDKYADKTLISHTLRGCPKCLKSGYHSWMYQYNIIDKCPIHGVDLTEDLIPDKLWGEHFEYLPNANKLDVSSLMNTYVNVFQSVKKIYYQDLFFGVI